MPSIDLLERGKKTDVVLYYVTQAIGGQPGLSVMLGAHPSSLGLRVLQTDPQGRMVVTQAASLFDIINQVLADTVSQIFVGAPIYRRVVFYAQNANANIAFRRQDNVLTNEITVVPNVPFTLEGIFVSVQGRNTVAGVPSTLQAVVSFDPLTGQV